VHPGAPYGTCSSIKGGCSDSACAQVSVLRDRGTGGYAACYAASCSAFLGVWSILLCCLSRLLCRERGREPKEQAQCAENMHLARMKWNTYVHSCAWLHRRDPVLRLLCRRQPEAENGRVSEECGGSWTLTLLLTATMARPRRRV